MRASVLVEAGSAASRDAAGLIAALGDVHGWEWSQGPEVSPGAFTFVLADTVSVARRLAAQASSSVIFVGVVGEGFGHPGTELDVGSVPELLETTKAVGLVPAPALQSWSSGRPTFVGRKDVMEQLGLTCFKAAQSDNYCVWVQVPGKDLAEFLALLANAASTSP